LRFGLLPGFAGGRFLRFVNVQLRLFAVCVAGGLHRCFFGHGLVFQVRASGSRLKSVVALILYQLAGKTNFMQSAI
jgi:hypothetical protein